jgi:ferredoxin
LITTDYVYYLYNIYTAEIRHQGNVYTIPVPADQTVLAAAKATGLELPTSCGAGVCTTCAAQVLSGTVDQREGMGVSAELQQAIAEKIAPK